MASNLWSLLLKILLLHSCKEDQRAYIDSFQSCPPTFTKVKLNRIWHFPVSLKQVKEVHPGFCQVIKQQKMVYRLHILAHFCIYTVSRSCGILDVISYRHFIKGCNLTKINYCKIYWDGLRPTNWSSLSWTGNFRNSYLWTRFFKAAHL